MGHLTLECQVPDLVSYGDSSTGGFLASHIKLLHLNTCEAIGNRGKCSEPKIQFTDFQTVQLSIFLQR